MEKKDISLLLYNGTIYSMENEVYNWVAVKDGKIYKTGCNDEYKSLFKFMQMYIVLGLLVFMIAMFTWCKQE